MPRPARIGAWGLQWKSSNIIVTMLYQNCINIVTLYLQNPLNSKRLWGAIWIFTPLSRPLSPYFLSSPFSPHPPLSILLSSISFNSPLSSLLSLRPSPPLAPQSAALRLATRSWRSCRTNCSWPTAWWRAGESEHHTYCNTFCPWLAASVGYSCLRMMH